jgi:Mg-chelatase subunit ChlD
MIWGKGILGIACLLLLITVVSAEIPDLLTISSSSDWLVANTVDTSTITVHAINISSGNDVSAVPVTFSTDNIAYGSVSPLSASTNAAGLASTTFRVNKTSGTALIFAIWTYTVGGETKENVVIYGQQIDHNPTYSASLAYQSEVIVDQTTPFIVTLKDIYQNRVDNKNPAAVHTMKFKMYMPPGGMGTGGLKNATSDYATTFYDSTDAQGNITLTAKVDTVPGENTLYIAAIENMPDPLYPFIRGITQATPFFIGQVFSPTGNPPALPADGSSYFTIVYTLTDKFGNAAGHQTVSIVESSDSGNRTLGNLTTNDWGQVWTTYIAPSTTGFYNLTAVALANTSVWCSQTVQFYDTDPVSFVVTANPQMMPSKDVPANPPTFATINAKVMDMMGNGVDGQTVSFTLTGYTNSTILTTRPSFSSGGYLTTTSAVTDANGNAAVAFYPGEFPTIGTYYQATANGTATVTATWKGRSMPITLSFKNYPYLRVETSVSPAVVNVSSFFDVDIRLIGDGWKLQAKQTDVVLCTDRSGSMLYDDPDRMYSIREAAKQFIDSMTDSWDAVALVTFGRNGYISRPGVNSGIATSEIDNAYTYPITYSDYATVDKSLTTKLVNVKNTLDLIVPDHGTPMRSAIYKSVKEIKTNGRTGTLKVIVLLSDGDYNWYGDPLARGSADTHSTTGYSDLDSDYQSFSDVSGSGQFSEQNISVFAKNNNITIYSIGFASSISAGGQNTLRILAESTGGKYYNASAANIADIYKTIAGELKALAGVNTQMQLTFQNVNVTYNNVTTQVPGQQVFSYIYVPGVSTWVTSWNETSNPLPDQVPIPSYPSVSPDYGTYTMYPYSFDQTSEWLSSTGLTFNAGNISVKQTWETKFRFRVDKPGNIQIFGPGSKIVFNNGEATLDLPETYISAVMNLTSSGLNSTTLDIYNLHTTAKGVITDSIPLEWGITYGGNQTVTERISYSNDGGNTWVMFDTNYVDKNVTIDHTSLDVRTLPPGEYYIRVDASAPDAPSDRETLMTPGIVVGTGVRAYIKLE